MKYIILAAIAGAVALSPAKAELTNTAANGFTVKHQAVINGSAEDVWKAMIAPSRYWNPAHSWTNDAENFYLVPQAGGCFCELIRSTGADNIKSSDGSVQHMRVIYAHNNKVLRMSGALGPLQGEALTGTLSMELKPSGDQTAVRFTYKVGGYMEFKVDEIAPAVDGVIGEQLTRLAALFGNTEEAQGEAADDEEGDADPKSSDETEN